MDTKTNSRIQKLEFLLKQMDKIHLRDAAEILNVSEMTIRRDLGTEPGSLVLLGGYIVKDPQHLNENSYFILEQQNKNIVQKMQIGKLAAEQIKEGDVVFFDCGSTIGMTPMRCQIGAPYIARNYRGMSYLFWVVMKCG